MWQDQREDVGLRSSIPNGLIVVLHVQEVVLHRQEVANYLASMHAYGGVTEVKYDLTGSSNPSR